MSQYLLDNNALSEAPKQVPDKGFMNWFTSAEAGSLRVSCLSLGEIQKGIAMLPVSGKRAKLEHWLDEIVSVFEGHIVAIDWQTTLLWGKLLASAVKACETAPIIDALIAAQCMQYKLTLVTRNAKDFEQFTGLDVLNPWDA